ncbi:hypothetical protein HDU76_007170 [Blyttiomyces sp. JEL0837]|nr:hypothetical protein HDU76_007170 [Blyttiomyces sp. JEL0837]
MDKNDGHPFDVVIVIDGVSNLDDLQVSGLNGTLFMSEVLIRGRILTRVGRTGKLDLRRTLPNPVLARNVVQPCSASSKHSMDDYVALLSPLEPRGFLSGDDSLVKLRAMVCMGKTVITDLDLVSALGTVLGKTVIKLRKGDADVVDDPDYEVAGKFCRDILKPIYVSDVETAVYLALG